MQFHQFAIVSFWLFSYFVRLDEGGKPITDLVDARCLAASLLVAADARDGALLRGNQEVTVIRLSSSSVPSTNNSTSGVHRRVAGVKAHLEGQRPRAAAFATTYNKYPRGPAAAGLVNKYGGPVAIGGTRFSGGQLYSKNAVGAVDFNPQLLSGARGLPGIKLRLNTRGFQYVSTLARQVLDREIVRARIPDITQQVSEVNGKITLCNIHVSHYRPPKCVEIMPSPPNLVVIRAIDFDVGVTGNLDGMAFIILPIKLHGIVHAKLYHVSATITLSLERAPNGAPYVLLCGCDVKVPQADVCIERGGLVGDLANAFARGQISQKVQKLVPEQVCGMLPQIINQRINPLVQRLPQYIGFSQIASVFSSLMGSNVPDYCYSAACQATAGTAVAATGASPPTSNESPSSVAPPPDNPPPPPDDSASPPSNEIVSATEPSASPVVLTSATSTVQQLPAAVNPSRQAPSQYSEGQRRNVLFGRPINLIQVSSSSGDSMRHRIRVRRQHQAARVFSRVGSGPGPLRASVISASSANNDRRPINHSIDGTTLRQRVPVLSSVTLTKKGNSTAVVAVAHREVIRGVAGFGPGRYNSRGGGGGGPCSGCPPGSASDSFGLIKNLIIRQLDMRKLADVVLTTQITRTYATPYDYNIDLNGEFSPRGLGGTPFGPYPMNWPSPYGMPMAEILISDFTINSLLYAMHKRDFISIRIGPQTPGIGPLLTTTCGDTSDYSDEDDGNDDGEILLSRLLRLRNRRRSRYQKRLRLRQKRQNGGSDSGGGGLGSLSDLADLGICVGDIMPAIKEKYPNQTLAIVIHTARALSVQLTSRPNGDGVVTLNAIALADFYLDRTNTRVGTLTITAVIDVVLRMSGNRISGTLTLPVFQLNDRDGTLGLEQDALDNLASLAKDLVVKAANQQLQGGIPIPMPTTGLPVQFMNPQIRIINHAIYLGADVVIPPSLLQGF